MPATAENQLQSVSGIRCISHLSAVQVAFEADVAIETENDNNPAVKHGMSKLKGILDMSTAWLSILPSESSSMNIHSEKSSDISSSPMERCLAREIIKGYHVLATVRNDLNTVM